MATLIKNGTVVTATETVRADVRVEDGRVTALGSGLDQPGDEVVDATGRLVLPGGIDVHTHLDMPFADTVTSDDFETGTIAAAHGGTTTVVDFIVPEKGKPLPAAVETWRRKAEGRAAIDFGFHCCVNELTRSTLDELGRVMADGITSFKVFTAYPGALMLDDGAILRLLRWAASQGALIQVHAENGPAIAVLAAELAAQGRVAPLYHGLSRPPSLEGEATSRVIALAELAEAPLYVVHLSCSEALAAVRGARARGLPVYAETCPQYLYLSLEDLDRPDFEGAKYVCSPPLRPKLHAEELWRGLATADLQTVATDHCPFNFRGQKDVGRDDFRKIPNGLPSLETRVPLMMQGAADGRLGINRVVDALATSPAKLFGLYPRKGTIAPGSDADLVLWDPERPTDLSVKSLHMRVDYSLYEGQSVKGGVERVLLRGRTVIDDGKLVGRAGDGMYLQRQPFTPGAL